MAVGKQTASRRGGRLHARARLEQAARGMLALGSRRVAYLNRLVVILVFVLAVVTG